MLGVQAACRMKLPLTRVGESSNEFLEEAWEPGLEISEVDLRGLDGWLKREVKTKEQRKVPPAAWPGQLAG